VQDSLADVAFCRARQTSHVHLCHLSGHLPDAPAPAEENIHPTGRRSHSTYWIRCNAEKHPPVSVPSSPVGFEVLLSDFFGFFGSRQLFCAG